MYSTILKNLNYFLLVVLFLTFACAIQLLAVIWVKPLLQWIWIWIVWRSTYTVDCLVHTSVISYITVQHPDYHVCPPPPNCLMVGGVIELWFDRDIPHSAWNLYLIIRQFLWYSPKVTAPLSCFLFTQTLHTCTNVLDFRVMRSRRLHVANEIYAKFDKAWTTFLGSTILDYFDYGPPPGPRLRLTLYKAIVMVYVCKFKILCKKMFVTKFHINPWRGCSHPPPLLHYPACVHVDPFPLHGIGMLCVIYYLDTNS